MKLLKYGIIVLGVSLLISFLSTPIIIQDYCSKDTCAFMLHNMGSLILVLLSIFALLLEFVELLPIINANYDYIRRPLRSNKVATQKTQSHLTKISHKIRIVRKDRGVG